MGKLIDTVVSHFQDKANRPIDIPEWGVTIYAKPLTMGEKAKWLSRADGDTTKYMLYTIIGSYVDDAGEPVFDMGDLPSLQRKSDEKVLSRLYQHVNLPDDDEIREGN